MSVPSASETIVAMIAICTLVSTASMAPALRKARPHHSSVKPGGGHVSDVDVENEFTSTTKSGTYTITRMSPVTTPSVVRESRESRIRRP